MPQTGKPENVFRCKRLQSITWPTERLSARSSLAPARGTPVWSALGFQPPLRRPRQAIGGIGSIPERCFVDLEPGGVALFAVRPVQRQIRGQAGARFRRDQQAFDGDPLGIDDLVS